MNLKVLPPFALIVSFSFFNMAVGGLPLHISVGI